MVGTCPVPSLRLGPLSVKRNEIHCMSLCISRNISNITSFELVNSFVHLIYITVSRHVVCHISKLFQDLASLRCIRELSSKYFVNLYILLHDIVHLTDFRIFSFVTFNPEISHRST